MSNKEWKKWLFWFSFAVASIVVYKTIDSVAFIMEAFNNFIRLIMPFILATLIAYILYLPSKKIENAINKTKLNYLNKHSRGLSVFITYSLSLMLIFLVLRFVMPIVTGSILDLAYNIPSFYNTSIDYFNNLDEDSILNNIDIAGIINSIQNIKIDKMIVNVLSYKNINTYLKSIISVTGVLFDLFVTIIVSIYMLLERNSIKEFLKKAGKAILDKKQYDVIARYYERTNGIFFNFIASQIIDAVIVGIITTIAMLIIGVKYAILLGFLIGLFNVIPYFGAIFAIGISIIITIFTGGPVQALILALVVIVLQQIDANIINPKILGDSLELSPILIIFAVTAGGNYFGVLGMFLGVPVIAFIKIVIEDYIETREKAKKIEKVK